MARAVVVAIGVLCLVAALAAANMRRETGAIEVDWRLIKPPAREVSVEPPSRGLIVQTVTAPGTIEPVDEAEIASRVVGRVIEVNVNDGDTVKKNQVLVRLDQTEARARLESVRARRHRAEAGITQAKAELTKALRDADRLERLAGRNASSNTEMLDAKTSLSKAEAFLAMSQNDLADTKAVEITCQQELDYTEIRAPIDGVVAGCTIEVGEVVIAGTTNLPGTVMMTVGDLSHMQARANVDEADVPLVLRGQPARIYLQSDLTRSIKGNVDRVAPKGKKADEVVSFETLVRIDSTDELPRSGMTATVEIEVRRSTDALGVPVQAVVHRRRKDLPNTPEIREWAERHARTPGEKVKEAEARYVKIVFVLDDGVARARPVETGISDERRIEILSGLKPTDRVVTGPFRALDELRDGDPASVASPESHSDRHDP